MSDRTIRVLPELLANKIAAGEVVQRPASAVKELLENSIDAGARSVTVVIADGGTSSIQVVDDGAGMGPEDALAAFDRHATSKIAVYEDLERIRTLGFRGEALASIAAVSQVELKTRRAEDEVAARVRIEGGKVLENGPSSGSPGTSITVKNLFFNTPARRKFLKSSASEYKQVYDVVQRIALAHPGLAVAFRSDGEKILDLRASTGEERVRALFGEKLSGGLIPFEERLEFMSVGGFLGRPAFARKTHAEQYLFLNGRFIANRPIGHAVFKAYEHLLEKGSFPLFILFLTIDPRKVDVNVHPAKLEVKFDDESAMYRFVHSAVRRALSGHDLIPAAVVREGSSTGSGGDLAFSLYTAAPVAAGGGTPSQSGEAGSGTPSQPAPNLGPLWQVHNKYIIAPVEEGVMVIDQHAAHERVLYERAIARFAELGSTVQQLLFPHTFELSPGDAAILTELLPYLEGLGFSVRMFGKTAAVLDGVPPDVRPGSEKTILGEMIDLFKEDAHSVGLGPREKLAKSFSCRAAVKAGDPLNAAEMRALLDQLFATSIPFVCPHGRPSMIRLSLAELDRRFGRTS